LANVSHKRPMDTSTYVEDSLRKEGKSNVYLLMGSSGPRERSSLETMRVPVFGSLASQLRLLNNISELAPRRQGWVRRVRCCLEMQPLPHMLLVHDSSIN
jgi:hypothetical protein